MIFQVIFYVIVHIKQYDRFRYKLCFLIQIGFFVNIFIIIYLF